MSTEALIFMLLVQVTIIGFTLYFFFKVLRTPDRPEPDSYSDNDPKPEKEPLDSNNE